MLPTLEQAREILAKYNKEPFHMLHGETVSGVMGWFAEKHDPANAGFWRVVGMLHDIDFELYPEEHCVRGGELLRGEGVDEGIIKSAMSHGWGMTGVAYEPASLMEKILFATDELTGLIGAAALMRPSKSVSDMEPSSVMKKFKDKKFAAGCSRETIQQGADMLGWPLPELVGETLAAMKEINI
jgi:predicted hydrolase (HD superfamily)